MKEIKHIEHKKVLLDTNILIYCGRGEFGKEFQKILRTLKNRNNDLGVSLISGFEILKKYTDSKTVVDYYIKLLNFIPNVPINRQVLINAARLSNAIYRPKKDDYKRDNDMVIGATTITYKAWLLTCNRKDFAKPYWRIEARDCVQWEDSECNEVKLLNVFLLSPNLEEMRKKNFYPDTG